MNPKLRRDRNAFLVFLAAVPFALLIALPLAEKNGRAYVAAKEQQMKAAQAREQQQSGAGGTQPARSEESSGK
jgi:hypothetical protein